MTDKYEDYENIPGEVWEKLATAASAMLPNAYIPYSNFPVGAALLTDSEEIIAGCNVENATLGATVCAERTAIGCSIAAGHQAFKALCVITNMDPPSAPCGICRQVLAEFCDDLPILLINPDGGRRFTTLNKLLPMRFSGRDFLDPAP